MDVRNCRGCGRLFNYYSGQPICQACKDELEKKFGVVKEYLRQNPNTPIQIVSDDNEVSVKQIKQRDKEERLTFSEESPIGIECEGCGATIKTGRFCEECKGKMKNDLKSVMKQNSAPIENSRVDRNGNRMRYL